MRKLCSSLGIEEAAVGKLCNLNNPKYADQQLQRCILWQNCYRCP
jgi:hypothetical protein